MRWFANQRRRRNYRPHVSTRETIAGAAILVLLAVVVVSIYTKGKRYDPNVFALDPSLLTASEVLPVLDAEPAPDDQSSGDIVTPTTDEDASAGAGGSFLPPTLPSGWRVMGRVERYTPDNLYIKINGRAEQYLSYGVVGMETVGIARSSDPSVFIDAYVYDMGTDTNALGIFSIERSPGGSVSYGDEGYRAGASIFFRKGRYYTQLLPSDDAPAVRQAADALARSISSAQPASTQRPWAMDAFPKAGLIAGTFQYQAKDALGISFLKDVYTSKYRSGDAEVVAFLTRAANDAAAQALFEQYVGYIDRFGEPVEGSSGLTIGDFGGSYDIVFRRGTVVGGVSAATDQAAAESVAELLRNALK